MDFERKGNRIVCSWDDAQELQNHRVCSDCWGMLGVWPIKGDPHHFEVGCYTEGCAFRGSISMHTRDKLIADNAGKAMKFRGGMRRYAPDVYKALYSDPFGKKTLDEITDELYGGK